MKVFLGKYPSSISIRSCVYWVVKGINAFLKFLRVDFYVQQNWVEDLFESVLDKIDVFLRKNFPQTRKEKVIIHDYDLWSLDNSLALIIHPALVRMKEIKHGAAMVDDEDVPDEIKATTATSTQHDEFLFKRWDYVLDEMIWAFAQLNDFGDTLITEERELTRMRNGFRLFGKYYMALWD